MPHPPQQSPADSSVAVKFDEDALVLTFLRLRQCCAIPISVERLVDTGSLYSGICSVGGIRGNPYQGPVKGTDRLTGTTCTFGWREYPKRDCRRRSQCITGTVITVTQRLSMGHCPGDDHRGEKNRGGGEGAVSRTPPVTGGAVLLLTTLFCTPGTQILNL